MVRAVLTGHSTVSGFELALCSSPSSRCHCSSPSSRCRCIFDRRGTVYITIFLVTFFPLLVLPFSELSLVRLALDRRLTNHCFSVLEGGISSAVLLRRLDLGGVTAVLRAWRLGWCGRVRRAASCIGSVARLGLPGAGGRGGPGRMWSACVRNDMTICNLELFLGCRGVKNECEALPGVAYPGVRDNRSTINTKTGYMMMMMKP